MMNKWITFGCLFILPCLLFSQDLKVTFLSTNTLSAAPGKVSTYVVELHNVSTRKIESQLMPVFPEDWKAFQNTLSITLVPNQKVKKLISFVVPHKAIAGEYNLSYQVKNRLTKQLYDEKNFNFSVTSVNKLEILPLDIPKRSMAGTKIKGSFLVKNLSNQPQKISLTSTRGTILGKLAVELQPYDNEIIEVEVDLPKDTRVESQYSFTLLGKITGTIIQSSAYLHTIVLPIKDFFEEDRRKLPGFASINYLLQNNDQRKATGLQGELFIAGNIDEDNTKQVEFSLRGPNRQGNSDILLYDEYYATYQSEKLQAKVGDQNFSLSRLTEFSRNARGVGIDLYFPEQSIGAFAALPRFFPDIKHEVGAYFSNHFNENNTVSFNYLGKQYVTDKQNASIMSISGKFAPFKNTFLEVELASGQGRGKEGNSGFVSIQTRLFKNLNISAYTILSSPHFDGYYRNTKSASGNLNWRFKQKIQLFANVSQDDRNAALDTLFQAAPFSRRKQVGLQLDIGTTTNLQLAVRENEMEDRMVGKLFHRNEQLLTAKLDNRYSYFSWSWRTELGKFKNLSSNSELGLQNVFRNTLDLNYEFNRTSLSLFGSYFNKNSLLYEGQKQYIYGGAINTQITSTSHLNIRYQNTFAVEEYFRNRNTFNFSYAQKIGKFHSVSFNMRQTLLRKTIANKDFSMSIKYAWNFYIALEKPLPKGDVTGFIYRKNLQAVGGILLYLNGKTAISDDNGRFKFEGVKPGTHFILIDKSTLALHELPVQEEPISIEILPDITQNINIELVKTGELIGEISMNTLKPVSLKIKKISLDDYLIQVKSGNEIRRINTDENGRFYFKDLRPGIWEVSVLNATQNKQIILENTYYSLEIEPEKKAEVYLKAKLKNRKIRFKKIRNYSDDE